MPPDFMPPDFMPPDFMPQDFMPPDSVLSDFMLSELALSIFMPPEVMTSHADLCFGELIRQSRFWQSSP
jgi:hypothetical protein